MLAVLAILKMDLSITSILVYLLAGLLLGLALPRLRGSKPVKKPIPGLQPSNPQMGNLGDMKMSGSLHDFLCKNHSRFGPIFTFWWGQRQVCAIGHPEFLKSVQDLHARPAIFELLDTMINKKSILYTNNEEYFRRKKNYLDPAFSGRTIDQQGDAIAAVIREEYLPQWKQFAKTGAPVITNNYFFEITIKVITRFAMGEIFNDPKFIKDIYEADNLYWKYMERANRGQIDETTLTMAKEAIQKLKAVCQMVIDQRRSQPRTGPKIFIDYLLEEADEELYACEMIIVFVGGFHNSGSLLSWIMYDLCRHPQIQVEIQKEIDEKTAGEAEVLSLQTAGSLVKLRNAIDESLRLHALVIFHARYSDVDTQFPDGYVLPANTPIIISEGKVNLDNGIFKDAGEYIPDRFLSSEGREPLAFTPFGFAGKRSCPGKLLAYGEETIVVGTLLKHFNIRFHESQTFPVLPETQIVTTPKSNIVIVLEPRQK